MLKPRFLKHHSSCSHSSKRDRTETPSKPATDASHKKARLDPPRSGEMGSSHSFGRHRGTSSLARFMGTTLESLETFSVSWAEKGVPSYHRPWAKKSLRVMGEVVWEARNLYLGRLSGVNRELEKLHRERSKEVKVAKALAMEKEALRNELAHLSEEVVASTLNVVELEVANKALVTEREAIREAIVAKFLASPTFGRRATHFSLP